MSPRRLVATLLATLAVAASIVPWSASGATGAARVPDLAWHDCGDGLQCATASVPLDHDRPGGRQITLSLARLPATDPDHRIGTLFVNNGGPGQLGHRVHARRRPRRRPGRRPGPLRHRRLRPPGVGESTPVRCFADAARSRRSSATPAVPGHAATRSTQATVAGARARPALPGAQRRSPRPRLDGRRRPRPRPAAPRRRRRAADVRRLLLRRPDRPDLRPAVPGPGARRCSSTARPTRRPGRPATRGRPREPFSVRVDSHLAAAATRLGFFLDSCQAAGPTRCAFASADTRAKFDALMATLLAGPVIVDLPPGPPVRAARRRSRTPSSSTASAARSSSRRSGATWPACSS